ILPAAPALFSTTTACFQTLPSASAMMRGRMSAVPPAGLGTMILTGAVGKASPAQEPSTANSKPTLTVSLSSRRVGVAGIRQFPQAMSHRPPRALAPSTPRRALVYSGAIANRSAGADTLPTGLRSVQIGSLAAEPQNARAPLKR